MKVTEAALPGVLVLEPRRFPDDRGWFEESWARERHAAAGLPAEWAQDNLSRSRRGVIRGLHFQSPGPQGKLVTVLHGAILDVVVDVRVGSPTFGRALALPLSAAEPRQLWVPRGMAHGFCALEDDTVVGYKCDARYDPAAEHILRWDDPALGIAWPVARPVVSPRDAAGRPLADFDPGELPGYAARA